MQSAGAFVDLVFHGLAFVPASANASPEARAACLHWPAYTQHARAEMPPSAWEPLEIDAGLLARLFEPARIAQAIGLFAELHDSVAAFERTGRFSLSELSDGDVASTAALRALRSLPEQVVELFRAGLLLCAREFARGHRARFEPLLLQARAAIEACVAALEPSLQRLDLNGVRLSATLGPRGRAFEMGIVVGLFCLPGTARVAPEPSLVLAVHERLVQRAAACFVARGRPASWSEVEAVALAAERVVTRGTRLEAAQAEWLDALDLRGLAPLDDELEQLLEEVLDVS